MISSDPRPPAVTGHRVTFVRVLAAEWTKLSGLRWMPWLMTVTVVAATVLALVLSLFARVGTPALELTTSGHLAAQLGLLALGALIGSGEFSTGTCRSTFTAVPRRLPVLMAQMLLTAGIAAVTATLALVGAHLATADHQGFPALGTEPSQTLRISVGFVLQLTLVALLGLGTGALVRSPAAALTTLVVLFVVLEQFLVANPGPVADTVRALTPGSGTRLFADQTGLDDLAAGAGPELGAWGGGAVLAGWTSLVLLAAAYRLRRHDVT